MDMEKPYSGRATITETANGLTIEIPPRKNTFAVIFLPVSIGWWLIIELITLELLTGVIGNIRDIYGTIFGLFWLSCWTFIGFMTIRFWLWLVMGKEIISFNGDELTIDRKAALLYSPKTYDLRKVRHFTLNPNDGLYYINFIFNGDGYKYIWALGGYGVFKFDYGYKTIKIAAEIDDDEGRFILEMLKAKNLVSE